MSIRINKEQAAILLRNAATEAARGHVDSAWFEKVERLSQLCEEGGSRTHIAFLGTVLVAKAMNLEVDLFAIKPQHAPDKPNSFSARSLCHSVLVPLANELDISIGVTGREPLNNQPYFRMTRLGDDTPVHRRSRAAFDFMIRTVEELQRVSSKEEARGALAAFIGERRRHHPRYIIPAGEPSISPSALPAAIRALVESDSENGRRAQAAVAGLMDAFAGPARVVSGRINDPSRRRPGDVCVRAADEPMTWEKVFEVRDKSVTASDVRIFTASCVNRGVREAAVVAVAEGQVRLDAKQLETASATGIEVTFFASWESIVDQALFWADDSKQVSTSRAVKFIHQRLIEVEASPAAVALWAQLTLEAGARRC